MLKLRIENIFYRIENQNYLPLPLDFVEPKLKKETEEKEQVEKNREKREKTYVVEKLKLRDIPDYLVSSQSEIGFTKILQPEEPSKQVETLDNALLSEIDLKSYLNGFLSETKCRKIIDWVLSEPKLGIGRDNTTRVTEEGKLYRVGMSRLKDFNIMLNFTDSKNRYSHDDIENAIVKFGGEGKMVRFLNANHGIDINSSPVNFKRGRFKIYLSTPTIFTTNNWQPDLSKIGISAKLVAACVGKPKQVGGFDIANRQPHFMHKAVPAGSVYFYETEDDTSILATKQGISLSDVWGERGFGIAYFGTY
jgi:CRISPR-associated protein Cmr3